MPRCADCGDTCRAVDEHGYTCCDYALLRERHEEREKGFIAVFHRLHAADYSRDQWRAVAEILAEQLEQAVKRFDNLKRAEEG